MDFIKVVKDVSDSASDAKIAEMRKTVDAANDRVVDLESRMAAEKFWAETEKVAPGAMGVNGDPVLGINPTPGWSDFLNEPVRPGSTITRRLDAERAVQSNNSNAFGALVKEFQMLESEKLTITGPDRPTVSAQAVPASVVATQPQAPVGAGDKTQVLQSEINAYNARVAEGKVTIEEANIKMKEHADAYRERRVIQDV